MRIIAWVVLSVVLCRVATGAESATGAADPLAAFRSAVGTALQADLKSALPKLDRIAADALPAKQGAILACMRERFESRKDPEISADVEPWTAGVLTIYRRYWRRVMLGMATRADGERDLARDLKKHLGGGDRPRDLDALEPLLAERIAKHGYHSLFGVTAPLREFMLWRDEADETYRVELPQGREDVHVMMMDGFASYGWLGYATCDYRHTGGWTKPDRLYAVRSAYDLESEDFRVSYLAHEGQHFADSRRFPGLEAPDLEYRAKLVELSKARSTLYDLLDDFGSSGSDNREEAHAWANRRVVADLAKALLDGQSPSSAAWKRLPAQRINAAAAALLEQDDRRRSAVADRAG